MTALRRHMTVTCEAEATGHDTSEADGPWLLST